MPKKPNITIVGPGRLGTALTLALSQAGFRVHEIVSRERPGSRARARQLARTVGANPVSAKEAQFAAHAIWLCVGDYAIRDCAESLARLGSNRWKGKAVFHSSGALASDELDALRRQGAHVASVHPMMSFVHAAKPSLAGVTFAVEGDPAAVRLARNIVSDLHGSVISIPGETKSLYHAWGAFASPLIVAELAVADRIAREIGMTPAKARKTLAPILRQTLENYLVHGPAAAFSGPIVRGDVETVRRHLKVLDKVPQAREVYLALARAAMRELPSRRKAQLQRALGVGESRKRKIGKV